MRIISRLNVGGPAIQAITLTQRMTALGYETTLVRGAEGPREGSMDALADNVGVTPVRIPWLRRELGPADLRALGEILRLIRALRPDIVHTHAAKAGTLGRLAVLASPAPRPLTVHTFHGHVLEGYFSPRRAALFRSVERFLAKRTSRLIAVSSEVKADLVRLGIASADRISVVPLGFDLDRFLVQEPSRSERRRAARAALGVDEEATLITLIARLVPIKRVDRFLRIAALLDGDPGLRFMVVGDGELRDQLVSSPAAIALGTRLIWRGFTNHVEDIYFASDIVALTSDNEGTPVSLIEAHASAVPVVSTDVGGVRAVVNNGVSGLVIRRNDEQAFADAVTELSGTARERGVRTGRSRQRRREFTLERLVGDLDSLYRNLIVGGLSDSRDLRNRNLGKWWQRETADGAARALTPSTGSVRCW